MGVDFDSVVQDARTRSDAVARACCAPSSSRRWWSSSSPAARSTSRCWATRPRTALPLSEIRFGEAFDSRPHIVSYGPSGSPSPECIDSPSVPCTLPPELERASWCATALAAFEALDCRDYGRVDLRLSDDGQPCVIDINPNCDLHPEAGFARSAAAAGLEYPALALRSGGVALERTHGHPSRSSQKTGKPSPTLLDRIENFSPDEVRCALELIDLALQPSNPDYHVLVALTGGPARRATSATAPRR